MISLGKAIKLLNAHTGPVGTAPEPDELAEVVRRLAETQKRLDEAREILAEVKRLVETQKRRENVRALLLEVAPHYRCPQLETLCADGAAKFYRRICAAVEKEGRDVE